MAPDIKHQIATSIVYRELKCYKFHVLVHFLKHLRRLPVHTTEGQLQLSGAHPVPTSKNTAVDRLINDRWPIGAGDEPAGTGNE